VKVAHVRLCHSRMMFARAYPRCAHRCARAASPDVRPRPGRHQIEIVGRTVMTISHGLQQLQHGSNDVALVFASGEVAPEAVSRKNGQPTRFDRSKLT
jgi:hypothetical protein